MLESDGKNKTKLKAAGVHDCVRIRIPRVDREKTEHPNILGVVVDVDETGLYREQTKQGVRNTRFCRSYAYCCKTSPWQHS